MAVVNELVTQFKFLGSLNPLKNFNTVLTGSLKQLTGLTLSIEGLFASMATLSIYVATSNRNLILLSQNSNVSIERIQELGYAATQMGSSIDAVQSTVQSLTANIADASLHGSANFSRLGISIRDANNNLKSADEVLMEVGKKFQSLNFSKTQQQSLASSLGIDSSLIPLLNSSDASLQKLLNKAKEFGVINKESSRSLLDLSNSFSTLKFGINAVKNSIGIALAPTIKEIIDKFNNFLLVNKDLIANGLKKTLEFVQILIEHFNTLLPIITAVIGAFAGMKIALTIINALTNPLSTIALIITAIVLIVDDLIVAFHGGNSLIREFVKNLTGIDITPVLKDMVESFKQAFNFISELFSNLKTLIIGIFTGDLIQAFEGLKQTLSTLYNEIVYLFSPLSDFFKSIFDPIINIFNEISNFVGPLLQKLLGIDFKKIVPAYKDMSNSLPSSPNYNDLNPINNTNNSNVNNATINQNVDIKITSNNPVETSNIIKDSLQVQLQDTQMQFKKGNR